MVDGEIERLGKVFSAPTQMLNNILEENNSAAVKDSLGLLDLIRRPELSYEALAGVDPGRPSLPESVTQQVNIEVKYEGYITRQIAQVAEFKRLENKRLPEGLHYDQVHGLRLEARQKLNQIQPASVGQAGRIAGVSPADIAVLLIYLESYGSDADNAQPQGV